jgi:hypothetical protein
LKTELAARDRQRVEGADLAHRVLFQVIEEWRAEPLGDPLDNRKMELQ